MNTLQKCWDALDNHYGDADSLEAEIYLNWGKLKTPKNDSDTVFIDAVEDGISLLESLGKDDERIKNANAALIIEEKLPEYLKREYSIAFTQAPADK